MPVIFSLITEIFAYGYLYSDVIFAAILIGILAYPKFIKKQVDGFQITDISESIVESLDEYRAAFKAIEGIAKDVTIDDKDSVAGIINIIESKKTLK